MDPNPTACYVCDTPFLNTCPRLPPGHLDDFRCDFQKLCGLTIENFRWHEAQDN